MRAPWRKRPESPYKDLFKWMRESEDILAKCDPEAALRFRDLCMAFVMQNPTPPEPDVIEGFITRGLDILRQAAEKLDAEAAA